MQAVLSISGAGDGGDAADLLLEVVGHGFEGASPPLRLDLRPGKSNVRLMAVEALGQLCTVSPAARTRAHGNQAAVRAAAAALASADAAAPPPEDVACFLKFVAGGFWSRGVEECNTPFATAAAAVAAAEREAELPLREAVDALPSLVRVAVRLLAAAPSTKAVVFVLGSLAVVLASPPFTERAAGGCDAVASAAPCPIAARNLS
jgi:hypothetical protein